MRIRASLAAGVMTTGVLVLSAGPATAQIDFDCGDYPDQAAAQVVLEANLDDPNGLDADHDGVACEDFEYASSGQVATAPVGGVATGDGSTVSPDSPVLPFLVGGLGLVAAGGAAVAARRSARGSA